jgi:hypothetical protein
MKFDKDNNGSVSRDEFCAGITVLLGNVSYIRILITLNLDTSTL